MALTSAILTVRRSTCKGSKLQTEGRLVVDELLQGHRVQQLVARCLLIVFETGGPHAWKRRWVEGFGRGRL